MAYPANAMFKHQEKSSRLWALLTIFGIKSIALIPHIIVLYVLMLVGAFVMLIGIFAVLFTGKYPQSFENYMVGLYRWMWRIQSYMLCMTEKYPPFKMKPVAEYPADLTFEHQEKSSRLWALLTLLGIKSIILIPQFLVMFGMAILAGFAGLIGIFAVLFTGKYPDSFGRLMVTMTRYQFRINAYYLCMTDKYPPIHWRE